MRFAEWNLLRIARKRQIVRVVTIKHPPDAIEGSPPDNAAIGQVHELPPQLAILMIAAGWVRSDTRASGRRHEDAFPPDDRRRGADRRSSRV